MSTGHGLIGPFVGSKMRLGRATLTTSSISKFGVVHEFWARERPVAIRN
jgi:hypothetical protein